jgi:hypothetical protein
VGLFGFCTFPKVFLTVSLYFYYDDRLAYIMQVAIISTIMVIALGVLAEELLLDAYRDKIEEFSFIDYYIFLYLDLKYII